MRRQTDDELRQAAVPETLIDICRGINAGVDVGRRFFHPQSGMVVEIECAIVARPSRRHEVFVVDVRGNFHGIHGGYFSCGEFSA